TSATRSGLALMLGMRTSASRSARASGNPASTAASAASTPAAITTARSASKPDVGRVVLTKGDHGARPYDTVERSDLLRDDAGDLLVVGDAQHGDQVFVAGDRVHLRHTVESGERSAQRGDERG